VKLRLVFKKPIRSAVNTMLIDRLDGLTAKIEGVFSKLQKKAEALDDLCVNRINDEDKLVMLEHTMAYLDEGLVELAELIESGDQPRKTQNAQKPHKKDSKTEWITYQEAAELLLVDKSTICRWAQRGILESNGKKGRRRRVSKGSVLIKERQDAAD
jgi:excisionase family DNA binding protein